MCMCVCVKQAVAGHRSEIFFSEGSLSLRVRPRAVKTSGAIYNIYEEVHKGEIQIITRCHQQVSGAAIRPYSLPHQCSSLLSVTGLS